METEETNSTEAPEIHYTDFQIESKDSKASYDKVLGPFPDFARGLFAPRTLGRHKFLTISFSFFTNH